MSKTVRSVLLACCILAYAVFARLVHSSLVQPEQQATSSSTNPVYLIGFALISVLALIYACRTIRSSQFSQADWGLGVLGKAWISIPILVVIIPLSLWDAKSGPAVTLPHALTACVILLASSMIIRALATRLIRNAVKEETGALWLSTAVTGLLFTLAHPNTNADFYSDLLSNFMSSSFIAITGSVFAPVVYDAVRLLNPPDSQSAILLPGILLVLYLVLTAITSLCVKRNKDAMEKHG